MPILWGVPQYAKGKAPEQIRRGTHPKVHAMRAALDAEGEAVPQEDSRWE